MGLGIEDKKEIKKPNKRIQADASFFGDVSAIGFVIVLLAN